jgi:hypothetical protein
MANRPYGGGAATNYKYERAGTASIFVPRVVHMVHPLVHGGIFCISFNFNDLKQYRGSGGPKPRGCAPLEPTPRILHIFAPTNFAIAPAGLV